jgi:hypothetical protein
MFLSVHIWLVISDCLSRSSRDFDQRGEDHQNPGPSEIFSPTSPSKFEKSGVGKKLVIENMEREG